MASGAAGAAAPRAGSAKVRAQRKRAAERAATRKLAAQRADVLATARASGDLLSGIGAWSVAGMVGECVTGPRLAPPDLSFCLDQSRRAAPPDATCDDAAKASALSEDGTFVILLKGAAGVEAQDWVVVEEEELSSAALEPDGPDADCWQWVQRRNVGFIHLAFTVEGDDRLTLCVLDMQLEPAARSELRSLMTLLKLIAHKHGMANLQLSVPPEMRGE